MDYLFSAPPPSLNPARDFVRRLLFCSSHLLQPSPNNNTLAMPGLASLAPRLAPRLQARGAVQSRLLANAFASSSSASSGILGEHRQRTRGLATASALRPRLAAPVLASASMSASLLSRRHNSYSAGAALPAASAAADAVTSTSSGVATAAGDAATSSAVTSAADVATSVTGAGDAATSSAVTSAAEAATAATEAASSSDLTLLAKVLTWPSHFIGDLLLAAPTPSYAISIIALAFIARCSTTIPLRRWQRRKAEITKELILPRVQQINQFLAVQLIPKARKEGWSHEQYQQELKKRVIDQQAALHKKYGTHPMKIILTPIAINLPLLIMVSMGIRHALSVPGSLMAAEQVAWLVDGLGQPDPLWILPFVGGITSFAAAEYSSTRRNRERAEMDKATAPPDEAALAEAEKEKAAAEVKTTAETTTPPPQAKATPKPQPPRRKSLPTPAQPPWVTASSSKAKGTAGAADGSVRRLSTSRALLAAVPPGYRRAARGDAVDKRKKQMAMPRPADMVEIDEAEGGDKKGPSMQDRMGLIWQGFNAAARMFSIAFFGIGLMVPSVSSRGEEGLVADNLAGDCALLDELDGVHVCAERAV